MFNYVYKEMSLNILIAEDNQYTAEQYNLILKQHGHDVTVTKDGEECLKKYQKTAAQKEFNTIDKNPYDVVVLDQSMPKKTGFLVAQEILDKKPSQRIVFASAYALTSEKESEALEERIEFLQKPFSLNKFIKTVAGR